MARYKVLRVKRYEAYVDAAIPNQAIALAQDIPGRGWSLVEDKVLGEVGGVDNSVRRVTDDKYFVGSDKDKN